MAEISVVIPVYMTEQYLARCVDSLLQQSFQDFELILVNDGSPDNCGRICDVYAEKDHRIKVIHQSNSGVSQARNKGLEIASGKYIVFVDSDDWVGRDYLLALSKPDADFVAHTFSTYHESGSLVKRQHNPNTTLSASRENILKLLNEGILGYTVCKRFSTDIIRRHAIRFNRDINHTEDTLFVLDYLEHARSIVLENEDHYFYIRYSTRNTLSNGATLDRLAMICTANSIICAKFFPRNSQEYEQLFYSRVGYGYMSYVNSVWLQNLNGPVRTYRFLNGLLQNADIAKILQYAPDAVWKLSLHERIICAFQEQRTMKILFSCLYASLTKGRKFA